MAITIDVPLQDETGANIVDENGENIIVGSITISDPITGSDFDDIVASLDLAAVTDGMRLAQNIRGNFLRFEIYQPEAGGDFRVTFNRQQFGGLFHTLDTAVGMVAGSFARRGGWLIGDILPRPTM